LGSNGSSALGARATGCRLLSPFDALSLAQGIRRPFDALFACSAHSTRCRLLRVDYEYDLF
jgi:hypothetical protein